MNFLASRVARNFSYNSLTSTVFRSYGVNAGVQTESQIVDFQNGVIFFKTPNDVPLTYKSLIKLEDGSQAMIVSLSEQTTAALLLNDKKFEAGEYLRYNFTGQEGVYTNLDTLNFGKIVNYLGKPINDPKKEDQGGKMNIYSNLPKNQDRKKIDTQIFTGNIAVDFTKPIAKGNFVVFNGTVNTGKTHLAAQTAINFIKNSVFDKSGRGKKVVYCNVNINETNTLFKDLQDADCLDDVIGFSASSKQPSGYYFAPFTALAYANYLKSQGTDVLLIFDDLVEHFTKESLIFNTVNQPFAPLNIVNELYAATGMFEKGSLTTIMVYDSNNSQPQIQASLNTYYTHLESICDVKIDFDFADPMYKSVLPKIDTTVSRSTYYWMPKIMQIYSRALSALLNELKEEKDIMVKRKELAIQVDPWECYLFLDSTYFMRLLISSRKQNIIEELLVVGFVIRAVEQDTISFFKDDPKVLIEELFKVAKELKEFEKTDILTYIARLAERDIEQPEHSQAVVDSINRFYELFFMHCRIQNKLLPYKKDYFN